VATGSDFILPGGVRARREAFGLLFYNSSDAMLTFVRSGDLLDVEKAGGFSRLRVTCANPREGALRRALALLLKKGLILETRADI
jgi:putative mycofactocin binding protein MftB